MAESGQKVWYILDFWHACDHLAKISKTLYGEATEQFSTCYERWRSLLWQGCVAAVIKELKELHASGRYTDKQCYDIQGEINYFTENKERMDYPLYRSVPLPIGSGVVESACKNVVAARMKTEWHDVDAGRRQGHAPAPCIREEPPLLERLREPAPFITTTADRRNPPGGCLTATTLSECTPSRHPVRLLGPAWRFRPWCTSMDVPRETIGAGEFKQECLALIDQVAATGAPIIISKYGKPVARLMPLESPEEIEQRILAALRSGNGGMLVDEATFLAPTAAIAGWSSDAAT